jgi:hypothetical protein
MEVLLDATHRTQRHKDEHTVPSTRGTKRASSEIKELAFLAGRAMRGKHDARAPFFIIILDALID